MSEGFVTQSLPCNTRLRCPIFKRYFKHLSRCFICVGRQNEGCRFKGNFKLFKVVCFPPKTVWPIGCRTVDTDTATMFFRYTLKDSENPQFRQVFNRPITSEDIELKLVRPNGSLHFDCYWWCLQNGCAEILLPELLEERIHTSQPNLIRRPREVTIRVTCGAYSCFIPRYVCDTYIDVCRTTLFSQTWLCTTCGCELCGICAKDPVASISLRRPIWLIYIFASCLYLLLNARTHYRQLQDFKMTNSRILFMQWRTAYPGMQFQYIIYTPGLRNYIEAPVIPQTSDKLSRCTQVPSPGLPNAWVSTLLGPRNACCRYTHPDARNMGSSLFYESAWRKESDSCQLRDRKTETNVCCRLFQDVYRSCRKGRW